MHGLIEAGRDQLRAGCSALDVATDTVAALEDSGLYIAGRGASANLAGAYELDACLVDGASRRTGAVAALQGFMSPILVARQVMERTPHVLLVGVGAEDFARRRQMQAIIDPLAWFTPAGQDEANYLPAALAHGTVGCVARDVDGRLAAATSTGGVFGKLPGRCGDTPIVGAGTWADDQVAVSCTGQGEYFIRVAAAVQVAHRMRWAGQTLEQAARAALEEVEALGGSGGLIAIDRDGRVSMPFVSTGMKRAALLADGSIFSEAF
jgi:L-asparaginase/beta-aspartyl-peptidase (threonine type)